jgi:hypothetical protein
MDRATRRSRQIDDQGRSARACNGARQDRKASLAKPFETHGLGKAGDFALNDPARGFRGDIARSDTRAAGGEDDIGNGSVSPVLQLARDSGLVVADNGGCDNGPIEFPAVLLNSRPREILAASGGGGIADGEDRNADQLRGVRW